MIYRNYPYSFGATFISVLANLGTLLSVFGAATMFGNRNRALGIPCGIGFIALAIFLFIYVGRILTDKLAEKWTDKNIRTKPYVAFQYVAAHPQEYDRVAAVNPAFAANYAFNEKGRLVKIKK